MCAQSMIAAPLHPPMSSSAAPLGSRSQQYPRDSQNWDLFNNYAPSNVRLNSLKAAAAASSSSQRPAHVGYDPYVAKWIADTASQTRARSVPAAVQEVPDREMTYAGNYDHQRMANGHSYGAEPHVPQTLGNWPLVERAHRSMSPDPRSRQNAMGRRSSADGADEQIASYLQIPLSINNSKGSLAEFAAQITCLFWFEESKTLLRVEESIVPPSITPLPTEATPAIGFRKWVTTLLSTTQVSQNVILLALLFIYRLKKLTLNVKGKAGSEYRLLTVALMLGNKFLDDNTYTNKTWADVSGISVSEIHVMEVEFLSNMKYNLYTSAEQWEQWHNLLGKFADYFDKASRAYPPVTTPMSMSTAASHMNGHSALPFTPPSEQLSPPNLAPQRMPQAQWQLPNPMPAYNMATNIPQPGAHLMEADLRSTDMRAAGSRPVSRKRSNDTGSYAPPPKHARTAGPIQAPTPASSFAPSISPPENLLPRLPIPTSSVPTGANPPMYAPSYPTTLPPSGSQLVLPAPAMMPHEQLWQQSGHALGHSIASSAAHLPSLITQNPQSLQHGGHSDADVSPTNTSYPHPSQTVHSPAGYLMYRNSPYRPVRQVNTLLAPPPTMALHNPLQHMSQQNTYYQPLSKGPIEPRQGMVPYLTPRQFQMAPMDPSRQMPPLDYRQMLAQR